MKILNKKYVIFFWAAIIFLAIIFYFSRYSIHGNEISKVVVEGNRFRVEIVKSDKKRYQGLSGRKKLCSECGMLFTFEESGIYSFTMRGMNFPLDIIWIRNGKIIYIAKNVSVPEKNINPNLEADGVLEINAGISDQFGIKIGDKIE